MRFAVINFDVQIKRKKYIILSAEHQLRELSCSHAIKYLKKHIFAGESNNKILRQELPFVCKIIKQ